MRARSREVWEWCQASVDDGRSDHSVGRNEARRFCVEGMGDNGEAQGASRCESTVHRVQSHHSTQSRKMNV